MIKFENTEVLGWEHAIRGMRNPMNSWEKSDSGIGCSVDFVDRICAECDRSTPCVMEQKVVLGPNDHDLMMQLAKGGPVHAKYRRMIVVYVDITAPLYWWKEYDTYKVGTVANSCSTMHKIAEKEFVLDDFSHEHLIIESEKDDILDCGDAIPMEVLRIVIRALNESRIKYLRANEKLKRKDLTKAERKHVMSQRKRYWWQMIQLLPSSYNQKRTVMLNYEVLANIYYSRDGHKLDEWRIDFIDWIENLPYSELITEYAREEPNDILISQNIEMPGENYPTACNLCNAYNWGDSDENVCKACQFYKYSKWAPAQSDIQMKQNIVAIAPDTTITQIRRDLRGYDISTFPKECDDVTLTPGETIIKHIPPENDEMDEDLIVEKNSDDIEEGFAL